MKNKTTEKRLKHTYFTKVVDKWFNGYYLNLQNENRYISFTEDTVEVQTPRKIL